MSKQSLCIYYAQNLFFRYKFSILYKLKIFFRKFSVFDMYMLQMLQMDKIRLYFAYIIIFNKYTSLKILEDFLLLYNYL